MTEVTSGVLVKMRHIRTADLCATGTKDWFAKYQIDMRLLLKGIPVEVIEATGDPFGMEVAKVAREEHGL